MLSVLFVCGGCAWGFFFLSLLAQRVCSSPKGAAAACTPCRSFCSLSRPLVLLLVVGPFVLVRNGISVHGGVRTRFACSCGAGACACVLVHDCVFYPSWFLRLDSSFGYKPSF